MPRQRPKLSFSEPQLLTLLLLLVRSEDDDEGRELARAKLNDNGLSLALLVNARLYSDWWRHLTHLVGDTWLAQRVRGLADTDVQLDAEQTAALTQSSQRIAASALGGDPAPEAT